MTAASPEVSVVVPTYNQSQLLMETISAALAQTFRDFEIVIVNDGSTDDTLSKLAPLIATEPSRLRVFSQENAGIGTARNRGLDEARGRYIALLDHDDLWMPGKLEAQVRFLRSHPTCIAVTVPWAVSTDPLRCVFDRNVGSPDGIIRRPMAALGRGEGIVVSSSLMFDRARAAGVRFEEERRSLEDYPFQIKLFGRGALGMAGDDILMVYRFHAGNASANAINHYNGIRRLREMDRAGEFAITASVDRRDLDELLAHIARTGALLQLLAGNRRRALTIYRKELPHQVRLGRFKFLSILPLLTLAPTALLRRRWGYRAQ